MSKEGTPSPKKTPTTGRTPTRTPGSAERLRSSDPDLKIIVGKGEHKRTYEYYSQIMAMHSTYIDNILATPMRDQETRTLNLSEIHADDWEKMMSYLQVGVKPPTSVAEVSAVLPWYRKYLFHTGLDICDDMLEGLEYNAGSNLDQSMAAVELVYQHSHRMTLSRPKAKQFITDVFDSGLEGYQSFHLRHIHQLIPALRIETDLWAKMLIFHRFSEDVDRETYLDSPLFPELVLTCIQAQTNEKEVIRGLTSIKVTGADRDDVHGTYVFDERSISYCKGPFGFFTHIIEWRKGYGWVLARQRRGKSGQKVVSESEILFDCVGTTNMFLPPKHGWRSTAPTNTPSLNPVLEYIY
jgi:hypothetical protein